MVTLKRIYFSEIYISIQIYDFYNPQNEMFATFQMKRYFIQNETSSKK